MSKYVSVSEAAEALGVAKSTLRRWDAEGTLVPERTPGGHRRYLRSTISSYNPPETTPTDETETSNNA